MFTSENNKKEFIEIPDVIKVVQEENNYFFKIIICRQNLKRRLILSPWDVLRI